jgi:hypothetical protein
MLPRGATINIYFNRHRCLATSGSRCQYLLPMPPRGPLVNYHYWRATSKAFHEEIFSDPCYAKDSKKTTVKKISSNITKIEFIYKTKVLVP